MRCRARCPTSASGADNESASAFLSAMMVIVEYPGKLQLMLPTLTSVRRRRRQPAERDVPAGVEPSPVRFFLPNLKDHFHGKLNLPCACGRCVALSSY